MEQAGSAAEERARRGRPAGRVLGLVLVVLALYLVGNGRYGVFDRDEARFALAVKEMAARGDFIEPTNWGELRFQKPVGIYWLGLASRRAFGPGPFALRFPSALAGLGVVLLTVAIARRRLSEAAAWRAGWIVATALVLVGESKAFTADATLLFTETTCLLAWDRLRDDATERVGAWQLLLWLGVAGGLYAKLVNIGFLTAAACALAFLRGRFSRRTKALLAAALLLGSIASAVPGVGFLGPVVMGGMVVFFLAHTLCRAEGRATFRRLGFAWGAPLALLLFAAWGIPALLRTHGAFFVRGVGWELFGQLGSTFESHRGFPGFYIASTVLFAFFPWGAFLPESVYAVWRRHRRDERWLLLLAWVLGPWLVVELMASKLPHYTLVTFPALAILVSASFERRFGGERLAAWMRGVEAVLFVAPCFACAALSGFLVQHFTEAAVRSASLGVGALALALGVLGAFRLVRGRYRRLPAQIVIGTGAIYLLIALGLVPALQPLRIGGRLARAVAAHRLPGEPVAVLGFTPASVAYDVNPEPERLDAPAQAIERLEGPPPGPLLIVPNGPHDRLLARMLASHPLPIEHVATVRGLLLPRLQVHELWLVRGTLAKPEGSQ